MGTLELQTFQAATMPEALALVRQELGPDAVILQTRQLRKGAIPGMRREGVEITASKGTASDRPALPSAAARVTRSTRSDGASESELAAQLSSLTEMVEDLCREQPAVYPRQWREVHARLTRTELPAETIDELMAALTEQYESPSSLDAAGIARLLVERLTVRIAASPLDPNARAVALVGPTGSGKTTTIAKLAAIAKLQEGKRVKLITLDTYRIGASEQLRIYAEILGVPMAVVQSAEQLNETMSRFADADLVLIDTAGRPPRDDRGIKEIGSLLGSGVLTVLTACATMSASSLRLAVESYRPLNYRRLILTKLDEVVGQGVIAGVARMAKVPISYVTTGPRAPEDIEIADSRRLARRALGLADAGWKMAYSG